MNEEKLEELYELLALYFEVKLHGGQVRKLDAMRHVEPALDRVIFREQIIAKITDLIIDKLSIK